MRLRLVLWVTLAWHYDLEWHVGTTLLWDDILTWAQHYDLLEVLILIKLHILVVMLHLLRKIDFLSCLHLWHSNDLVPWEAVILLQWLHWHTVSISVLVGLVLWKLDALLLDVVILTHSWNLNILSLHFMDEFLVLFQKLSWWKVLSHHQASIGATRSTWSTLGCFELLCCKFFN